MNTPRYANWLLERANDAFLHGNEGWGRALVAMYHKEFPGAYKPKEPSPAIQLQNVKDSFNPTHK